MALNFDILVAVMSHLEGSELLLVMQTCRALYSAGASYLLRSPVVLRSRAKILSFCRYVLIEPRRFQFLRSLEIRAPGRFQPGPKADLFLAMLMHAKCLEHLKVLDCEILMSHERIAPAIAALTSLKSLTLPALNAAGYTILSTASSQLTKIEVGFWSQDTVGPEDPVPLLARFTHCLQELRVTYAEFARQDIQYPCVNILIVDDCRFALALPIIRCFPNVRDLSLWTGQEDEVMENEEIEEHRQMNIHSQQEASWGDLEYLRGDIRSLYLLGLTSRVRYLDVHSTFLTSARARQLMTLLSEGRPFTLSIRIKVSELDVQILCVVLRPVKDSLVLLVIYLNFCGSPHADPEAVIKMLAPALGETVIADIVLHFCCDDEPDFIQTLLSRRGTSRLDLGRLANALVVHTPSLQRILLVDSIRQPLAHWKAIPGGTSLHELDIDDALIMLAEEGSFLI